MSAGDEAAADAMEAYYDELLGDGREARKARNAALREAVDAVDEAKAQVEDAWRVFTAAQADFDAKNAAYNEARFELDALLAPAAFSAVPS